MTACTECAHPIRPNTTGLCRTCYDAARKPAMTTCAVCGKPMSSRSANHRLRKACSVSCGNRLGGERRNQQQRQARADRIEDIRDLLAVGESPERIAARLGVQPESIARQMHRAGLHDTAVLFGRKAS